MTALRIPNDMITKSEYFVQTGFFQDKFLQLAQIHCNVMDTGVICMLSTSWVTKFQEADFLHTDSARRKAKLCLSSECFLTSSKNIDLVILVQNRVRERRLGCSTTGMVAIHLRTINHFNRETWMLSAALVGVAHICDPRPAAARRPAPARGGGSGSGRGPPAHGSRPALAAGRRQGSPAHRGTARAARGWRRAGAGAGAGGAMLAAPAAATAWGCVRPFAAGLCVHQALLSPLLRGARWRERPVLSVFFLGKGQG